jgi:long-chain acyl-CoA synthetase
MGEVRTPWIKNIGDMPATLTYRQDSMFDAVNEISEKYPDGTACDFMGYKISYSKLVSEIEICAGGLCALGIKKGDKVTVCMPNMPQTVIIFYALNRIGAVSSMIHPLSSAEEIEYYLTLSKSRACLTLDMYYEKIKEASANIRGFP